MGASRRNGCGVLCQPVLQRLVEFDDDVGQAQQVAHEDHNQAGDAGAFDAQHAYRDRVTEQIAQQCVVALGQFAVQQFVSLDDVAHEIDMRLGQHFPGRAGAEIALREFFP